VETFLTEAPKRVPRLLVPAYAFGAASAVTATSSAAAKSDAKAARAAKKVKRGLGSAERGAPGFPLPSQLDGDDVESPWAKQPPSKAPGKGPRRGSA